MFVCVVNSTPDSICAGDGNERAPHGIYRILSVLVSMKTIDWNPAIYIVIAIIMSMRESLLTNINIILNSCCIHMKCLWLLHSVCFQTKLPMNLTLQPGNFIYHFSHQRQNE